MRHMADVDQRSCGCHSEVSAGLDPEFTEEVILLASVVCAAEDFFSALFSDFP